MHNIHDPSQENSVKELTGTRLLLSGREKFDLEREENVQLIKNKQVKQVFMIFLAEDITGGYSQKDQAIEAALIRDGIKFIPLRKRPADISTFELFHRQVESLKGSERALVMCYHGLHNSAAYATYHLLKKGVGFDNVFHLLHNAGWSTNSIASMKIVLNEALKSRGMSVEKCSQAWQNVAKRREVLAGRKQAAALRAEKNKKIMEFLKAVGKMNK